MKISNNIFLGILLLVNYATGRKPYSKRLQEVWRVECALGVITDVECPVDGGWTPWGAWSTCHGTCDDLGHRRRTRQCVNPPPSKDGIACSGRDHETDTCYLTNCTAEDFQVLIAGDKSRMESFDHLKSIPALMGRCLQIECTYENIEAAVSSDSTWNFNAESVWNSFQCVKHNLGCPVRGSWSEWSPWSECSARCGRGALWRTRRCNSPVPSEPRLVCSGLPLITKSCIGEQCINDVYSSQFGGTWDQWEVWSPCSEQCGPGIRRRKRLCNETRPTFNVWGTFCSGAHEELEVCKPEKCHFNGGWSGWSGWGPCSQSCGAGKRLRTRSCTRPIPSGNGTPCSGPKTEIGTCNLSPCVAFTHEVALFNGDGVLQYSFKKRRASLFHFFMRFMPLSPHGTLVRRGNAHHPHMRVSLQNWHVCVDARGQLCSLPRTCTSSTLGSGIWNTVLVTVTPEAAFIRLNDDPSSIKSTFPFDPVLYNDEYKIWIGEKFRGEIQEVIHNFMPLKLDLNTKHRNMFGYHPIATTNVAYENAGLEEAYISLDDGQYLRVPCFHNQDEWKIDLTAKFKDMSGVVILFDGGGRNVLILTLLNMRFKFKFVSDKYHSESISSFDSYPDQWFYITISKKENMRTIEAVINSEEKLHILLSDPSNESLRICASDLFVGGVPENIKLQLNDETTPFSGTIASLYINNILQDLHTFSIERSKDSVVQVSSKTASISGFYHELVWGKSNTLNLTCLHARSKRSPSPAHWLYLDVDISDSMVHKSVRSIDDGRILRLISSANNELRGFYTCRAHYNKGTRNIVTYGVLGSMRPDLTGPDTTTGVAIFTTLTLVILTLSWLVIEGIYDIRNGNGFFRDHHLSPEEEAEAVCNYIDEHLDLIGSPSEARIAKKRARRKGHQMASRLSFAAQEPQGMQQCEDCSSSDDNNSNEGKLLKLPAIKSSTMEQTIIDRNEPCYMSSPRHGSILSIKDKLSISSSAEVSPRVLCSRLMISKSVYSPRTFPRRCKRKRFRKMDRKTKLLTIKSSTFVTQSTAQKVLQKFDELKKYDT